MSNIAPRNLTTVESIGLLLDGIMAIDADELEKIVQLAHECDIKQIEDPGELFPVAKQALRMFWHFRCNLESVKVKPADG